MSGRVKEREKGKRTGEKEKEGKEKKRKRKRKREIKIKENDMCTKIVQKCAHTHFWVKINYCE